MDVLEPSRRTQRFEVRATEVQARTIREAARATERTVTAFLTETAFEEAQRILTDSSHFILRDEEWRTFAEILERPAVVKPKLAALLASTEAPR
jgi:uncharacterized protein (DUF1778 family)